MARGLIVQLKQLLPHAKINFDLNDCDKILRVESQQLCIDEIVKVLKNKGFSCEVLD